MEMKIVTLKTILELIKKQKAELKAKGIEPTVENLGKYSVGAFAKKIKEQSNG